MKESQTYTRTFSYAAPWLNNGVSKRRLQALFMFCYEHRMQCLKMRLQVARMIFLRHHAFDDVARSQLSATWWEQMDDLASELVEKDCQLRSQVACIVG